MRTLFIACVACLFMCLSAAQADIFTVPLTDVTGTYGSSTIKSFSFDLGTSLLSVQSVKVDWTGTVDAGLSYWGNPFSRDFYAYLTADSPSGPHATGPHAGEATYPQPESFEAVSTFTSYSGQVDWSFLLDGRASGTMQLEPIFWSEFPPLSLGSGNLSSASLIIDAIPTPEPASAVLLGTALVLGLRRRDRR